MNTFYIRTTVNFHIVTTLIAILLLAPAISAHAEVTNVHADEKIGTVRQVYDGKLDPDLQINTFRNIDRLFSTATVRRGSTVSRLSYKDRVLSAVVEQSLAFIAKDTEPNVEGSTKRATTSPMAGSLVITAAFFQILVIQS